MYVTYYSMPGVPLMCFCISQVTHEKEITLHFLANKIRLRLKNKILLHLPLQCDECMK